MKKTITLLFIVLNCAIIFSQVGINTTTPDSRVILDINGQLKIGSINPPVVLSTAVNSVLVSEEGIVKAVPMTQLYSSVPSTLVSFLRGTGSGATVSLVDIGLAGGYRKIPFNTLPLDRHFELESVRDYSTTTNVFTAPRSGIYSFYLQAQYSSVLALAGTFGVAIFRVGSPDTALAEANVNTIISLAALAYNPSVSTLVKLNQGDQIYFAVKFTGISVASSINGGSTVTYFTAAQVQ